MIPLFDNTTPLAECLPVIQARIAEVVHGGQFILGPNVEAFEAEFASYLGVRHVIGVANGTDAITLSARAVGVKSGDKVVVPSLTFYATAEAIASIGAIPVFCDVDPETRNISVETVKAALTPGTKAIVAVDLFGHPAPIADLRELGLPVIEDAAQAAGAACKGVRAGALGDLATFSFYPSKNLGCFGDGGAVATNDDELAGLIRKLRFHGSSDGQQHELVGYNSRLDEIQAAVLRVLLPQLDGWCDARRAAGEAYAAAGLAAHVGLPSSAPGVVPAWHLYEVTHPDPDRLIENLNARGIGARGYYRTPLHRQPAMAAFASQTLPATDAFARTNLALPMHPALTRSDIALVADTIAKCA